MSLEIRQMKRSDIPTVAGLEADIYDQPWSPRVFFDELSLDSRSYFVAEDSPGSVVGYGGLLLIETDAHITTLAVAPEARGMSLGKRLMLALVDAALAADARHLTLEVRVSNATAQGLYEAFGFTPVGRRKNYYKTEDALIMWATDIDTDAYASLLASIRSSLEEAA
ncbi:MAG: ribosomal protein S18-alanine N-acetyltransferase [Acidimicrobiia bacterium]